MSAAGMPSRLRQVLPCVILLLASFLLYWAATKIDPGTAGRIGPAAWPKAVIVIMGLLCLYEIVKRLVAKSTFDAEGLIGGLKDNPQQETEAKTATSDHPRLLFGGIALVVAYVLSVPHLGFFLTTALFLAIFPWVGRFRRPLMLSVVAVAGSLALIVVFMRVAYISLPLGEGPFRALSLALLRAIGVS